MSLLEDQRGGGAMEEVELDQGYQFTLADASRPLVIDSVSRPPLKHFWVFLSLLSFVVLVMAFLAPKDYIVRYSFFKVRLYNEDHNWKYKLRVSGLSAESAHVKIATVVIRRPSPAARVSSLDFRFRIVRMRDENVVGREDRKSAGVLVAYHPRHRVSQYTPLATIPVRDSDAMVVDMSVDFDNEPTEVIVIEVSTKNPMSVVVRRQVVSCFAVVFLAFFVSLCIKIQARVEQMATLLLTLGMCLSSMSLFSDVRFVHYVECVTIGAFRAFLFYAIAFLANKHRTTIIHLGLALMFVCTCIDIMCKMSASLLRGHDILVHLFLAAVIGSTIASMSVFVEERYAFKIYFVLVVMSFVATILFNDLPLFAPHLIHVMEMRVAFYGVHVVLLAVLVFCHQGARGTKGDVSTLNSDLRDEPAKLVL